MPPLAIPTVTTTTVKVSLPAGLTPAELLYVALLLSLVLMLGMLAGLLFFLYVVDFRPASCPRAGGLHCCLRTDCSMESDPASHSHPEPGANECEHCKACIAIAAWRDGRECALRSLQQHFPNATIYLDDEKTLGTENVGQRSA